MILATSSCVGCGEISIKGWARPLQPFLRGYVRRQMQRS